MTTTARINHHTAAGQAGAIGIHVGVNIVEVTLPNGDEVHISHRDWLQAAALIPHREPRIIPAVVTRSI